MVTQSDGEDLVLYHRTSPEAAEQVMRDRSMRSEMRGPDVLLSNRLDGEAGGHGSAVAQLRVPADLAEPEDEFPDGEQHYRVRVDALRREHFVATWPDNPPSPTEQTRAVAGAELRTRPDTELHDQGTEAEHVSTADSGGITPTISPVVVEPGRRRSTSTWVKRSTARPRPGAVSPPSLSRPQRSRSSKP